MIDWLKSATDQLESTRNDEIVYSLDQARAAFDVREICHDGFLILKWDDQKIWLHFAVMQYYSSDGEGRGVTLACVFHGEGPSSNLRECRHTWWGNNGYLFYPEGKIISAGLKALSEFYDHLC